MCQCAAVVAVNLDFSQLKTELLNEMLQMCVLFPSCHNAVLML